MPADEQSRPAMYHTGLVVTDLEAAMRTLTLAFGVVWATPRVVTGRIRTLSGVWPRESRYTYSIGVGHHIELIQQIDPTAYRTVPGGPRVHHLGFWSDDLAGDVARLDSLGLPSVAHGVTDEGEPAQTSFHQDAQSGLWFELIDSRHRADMEQWWSGDHPAT